MCLPGPGSALQARTLPRHTGSEALSWGGGPSRHGPGACSAQRASCPMAAATHQHGHLTHSPAAPSWGRLHVTVGLLALSGTDGHVSPSQRRCRLAAWGQDAIAQPAGRQPVMPAAPLPPPCPGPGIHTASLCLRHWRGPPPTLQTGGQARSAARRGTPLEAPAFDR